MVSQISCRGALVGFDDHFVMDMADDVVVSEPSHGFCEDVPADCQDDVFDELGAVAFNAAPFFIGVRAEVGCKRQMLGRLSWLLLIC